MDLYGLKSRFLGGIFSTLVVPNHLTMSYPNPQIPRTNLSKLKSRFKDGIFSTLLVPTHLHPPRYPNPQIPRGWICTNSQLIMKQKKIEAMGSLPFEYHFNGFYRPDSFTTIDTGYVPGPCSGHLSSVTAAKTLHEIGQTDTSITGCDSAHVMGMVEPMDRPLVSNGEKLGQPGLFTSSPLEHLHQKSLNYMETQWRDDCGPPAPHSSENDLLESSGAKDRSNWYKEIFMNVAREMIHESEMRMGSLPVQDPSDGLSRKHQFSPMGPLSSNEGYVKDFLGSGISNAQFSGVQNGSLLDTAMNKSHGSGGAATPLTGVITLV